MTSVSVESKIKKENFQHYIPVIGDIHDKSPLAYQATRGVVNVVNSVQMAVAEAYINGLEVPDPVLRSLFDTCMPVFSNIFRHYWLLTNGFCKKLRMRQKALRI